MPPNQGAGTYAPTYGIVGEKVRIEKMLCLLIQDALHWRLNFRVFWQQYYTLDNYIYGKGLKLNLASCLVNKGTLPLHSTNALCGGVQKIQLKIKLIAFTSLLLILRSYGSISSLYCKVLKIWCKNLSGILLTESLQL